jgi:thioredoxin reductase
MTTNQPVTVELDYLIIGSGPAGLQLGYYLEKNKKEYLILETGTNNGTFFDIFPRNRRLISINKVFTGTKDYEFNLRFDWNSLLCDDEEMLFKKYSQEYFPHAEELTRYLVDFANRFAIKIKYGTAISKITKNGSFIVTDQQGHTYSARRLVIATGVSKSYIPPIPGIELCQNYADFSPDSEDFTDKRILIIGKGNSAFETADHLSRKAATIHLCSPHPVKMAWKTHYVGDLRAINNNFLDTYQLKSQNAVLDAIIENIERKDDTFIVNITYTHAKGELRQIHYDHVLVCTGFRFDDSLFDETCRPALTINNRFPDQTSAWESTNIKDLYFIGTLMQARDFKKTMSGFIHGFRYNIRALSYIFEQKDMGEAWPAQAVRATAEAITNSIIDRINTSSAMYLQPGFFCDLLVISDTAEQARYYCDIPADYVLESDFAKNNHYYTISLEYGDFKPFPDPFYIERDPAPDQAHLTAYLHPIIRRYASSSLVYEHHIQEDLENVYVGEKYTRPLAEFFDRTLADVVYSSPM